MVMKKKHIYLKRGSQKIKLRIYDGNTGRDENEISPSERKNFIIADREKRLNRHGTKQKTSRNPDQ